jgi:hypothetical protein
MSTTTDFTSNPTLSRNGIGSPADGKKMSNDASGDKQTSGMTVSSVVPVAVKRVDCTVLEGSGSSQNTDAGQNTNPLAGNDTPARGKTGQAGA